MSELPNRKSPGPDGIRKPGMLIDLACTAKCLSMLYKTSLDSGSLPHQWKVANVTPAYKGGDVESVNNYKPISLTSIPCKMIEHIILHHLNEILDNVLNHRQHSFRRELSCQTQLCATYHGLVSAADKGHTTYAIIMDFKEAFNKVPHLLLLQKLKKIPEINDHLFNWIKDSSRQQLGRRVLTVLWRGTISQYC